MLDVGRVANEGERFETVQRVTNTAHQTVLQISV